jgi:CBS domain containing-hemolysin-like protein
MKPTAKSLNRVALSLLAVLLPVSAHASLFQGETLDKVANGAAWVVLVVAPLAGIAIFLLIHILPEKIAEKKHHPQAKAIQCLCLLSLAFGGMLWPLAWLWAYTRPVLHKMAYGTDRVPPHGEEDADEAVETEADALRRRIAELESRLAATSAPESGKG